MRFFYFVCLLFFLSFSQLLSAQEEAGKLKIGIGLNSGIVEVPTFGLVVQPFYGIHLNSTVGNRFLFELSVAYASTRTSASLEALTFIDAKPKNYQNTVVDLITYVRLINVTEHVSLYGGVGITHIQTQFNHLYRVESSRGTVIDVEHLQRSGGRSSPLASIAFRSKQGARWQAYFFGTISLLGTRPDGGQVTYIRGPEGSQSGSMVSGGKGNYLRAGVGLSYRLR